MKKILSFLILCTFSLYSFCQDITNPEALKLVSANLSPAGLNKEDLNNSIVAAAYYNKTSGTQLVYLQQSHRGLPVFNQLQTLAFKNGRLISSAGSRLAAVAKSKATSTAPVVTPENAARTALVAKKLSSSIVLNGKKIPGVQKLDFGKLDVTQEKLTAELMWIPLKDGHEIKLAWQVYLVPYNTSDYWLINIDARSNVILSEINLTVYCSFEGDKTHGHQNDSEIAQPKVTLLNAGRGDQVTAVEPLIVNGASYRVVPYPAEGPLHTGGAPDLKVNPWTLAPGNATSLKWHSDGTNDWTYTRGNNVWSYHDRNNNNVGDPARSAQSSTPADPLSFDFVPDFTVAPTQTSPVPNQQFNITNLFYWNNIIHDLVYQYGFDEPSGNFQQNNQGRGGAGNDYVRAEAQDGSGTSNANFSTPADGGGGRMQMYLWGGSPQRDGDVDNGVVVHEFGHGISNRLAGGPAASGCVSNAEQMGEGWSDYYSLMATQDWANSLLSDGFNRPRGIGTYANGQTPAGLGIRSQRYCTNFAVNNKVYASTIPGTNQQHVRGELWCATLWDMTWNIINQVGSINPNLFDASAPGGNTIALKLVTEGLKLQACNSGFIDGRNGILAADQVLYNGAYRCAIMQAFARRGMGFDAQQGSANSTTDQVPGFSTVESSLLLTQNVTQQLENLNITYNNRVSAGVCSGLTNYLLTDTLPSNVTYVSGGTYNPVTRVVSFPVNIAAGQTQNYSFTVLVNIGSWFPTANLIDEQVASATVPATWVTSSVNSSNFIVSSVQSRSAPNSFFGVNAAGISDFSLATATAIPMGTTPPILSFWHSYNTEDGWDGGVVEISINDGVTWSDLGANMTENGYNNSMGTGSNNPLGGRSAFSGNSNGFIRTSVSLDAYANQDARFRFRAASDDNTAVTGWYIDDILLQTRPLVKMRSSLLNGSGIRVQAKDTVTLILENSACTPATIATAPAALTVCPGENASFSVVVANGSNLTYQWQRSTNGGTNFTNIAGAVNATLTLTGVTVTSNGHWYRVLVNGNCTVNLASAAAVLTVNSPVEITSQPANVQGCTNATVSLNINAIGTSINYQWQVSVNGGQYTSLSNTGSYSGVTTALLTIANLQTSMNGLAYRVIVTGTPCGAVTSAVAVLTVNTPPDVVLVAAQYSSLTPSVASSLYATASPVGTYSYQWFKNGSLLAGVTGSSYPVNVDRFGTYSVTATDTKGCSASSNLVTIRDSVSNQLFIYPNPGSGQFQVRYYSPNTSTIGRTLSIYDSKGARIYSRAYNISNLYERMDVNLTNMQSGVYMVELIDARGKRLASGMVVIQ